MAMAAVKSSKQTVLQRAGTGPSMSARIHPVVLFNICDSYVYRLLGSTSPDGTVEIKNSYVVPHNESADQVALDIDYHHNMFASHQKVNPKEALLDELQGPVILLGITADADVFFLPRYHPEEQQFPFFQFHQVFTNCPASDR
ncbi:eukaryotic translation initiation factor 3 subunit F-like isoform X3 [Carex rostrata]